MVMRRETNLGGFIVVQRAFMCSFFDSFFNKSIQLSEEKKRNE